MITATCSMTYHLFFPSHEFLTKTNIFIRHQTLPLKPSKPLYPHLYGTIYVWRWDITTNQATLKQTESTVWMSLASLFDDFGQNKKYCFKKKENN